MLKEIVFAISASGIAMATLAWLAKNIVSHFLSKDIEAYKSKLAAEAVNSSTEELVMRMRYDSLERTAYGFIKGNPDGWIIVFRGKYRPEHSRIPDYKDRLTKFGRAVSMDAYGNHIRMEHQEFSLNFKTLQKLKVE